MPLILEPIREEDYERLSQGGAEFAHLIVKNFANWRLYLNPDQTYLYRCFIWLLHEHTDLQQRPDLTAEQEEELRSIVRLVHKALARLTRPDMVNEFYAGNEYRRHRGHAHLHLIPRYFKAPFFGSRTFPDQQFGRNYAPYHSVPLTPHEIEEARRTLQKAVEAVMADPTEL